MSGPTYDISRTNDVIKVWMYDRRKGWPAAEAALSGSLSLREGESARRLDRDEHGAFLFRAAKGITFTRDQVEAWVGHVLTDDEIKEIEDALPNSSLPECVEAVAHEALGIDGEGREERS